MTTLKEFSKKYLEPTEAYIRHNSPVWRKAFPTELRTVDRVVVVKKETFWYGEVKATRQQVQEKWVRVHANEIIDDEWRDLYDYGEEYIKRADGTYGDGLG